MRMARILSPRCFSCTFSTYPNLPGAPAEKCKHEGDARRPNSQWRHTALGGRDETIAASARVRHENAEGRCYDFPP